jgi:hypothetical protein
VTRSNDLQSGPIAGATTAQLKADINSGRTGDKVGGFDPAASPLGTDEEAGGTSPDPLLIAEMRRLERAGRPDSATNNAASPQLQPDGQSAPRSYLAPAVAGVVVALALAAVLMALL